MFRRSWRHTAAVATVALLALSSVTACGDDSSDAQDLSENRAGAMENYAAGTQFKATEPLSFSVLYNNHPNYPLKNDWLFWKELTARTNVTLDPVAVPLSDYNQKRSLLIGAGDAPLLIPKTYPPDVHAYVSSGAILPVSDYLDLMPNLKDKIEKWNLKPELDTLRQADGKFYLLPGVHEKPWHEYSLVVRTDILDELGLEIPKTWDELYTVLKAMKAKYPDVYPFSDRYSQPNPAGNLLNLLAVSHGLEGAGWNFQHVSWNAGAQKFEYTAATEHYRHILEYLNKLVAEKLLDPESFTQTDDLARQKLANSKSFVISGNAQALVNDYRPDLAATNPKAKITKIPLPVGPAGEINPASRLENGMMISSKARDSKNFVAMMQFVDWLWYSDEGQMFARWGVEGTTYVKDAAGKAGLAEDVDMIGLNPGAPKHLQKDFGFANGVFAYGGKPELVQAFFSAEEQEFQKVMNARTPKSPPPPYPLTDEEREQVSLWETPLKDHVYQATLQFALGQRDLAQWDAYVTELKSKNMDAYLDTVNKAYERYRDEHN
ncbi:MULTISPECIES: extracellular solute-binding protein [Micromonospora]|uniref:Sugar ABC transporter substrate-binding protein n=1 Tax=Micromonospora maris TaxID=1003110 RepID=A0A9X0I1Z5_9ACTN|nr:MULTISPECIES: extracellular solute-binding protein [Micromonospora]AEB45937.1 extracellular solute-binding protein family 1 [Micromonospora maris AB-18-032]KUJ45247.1 sugar ABC transporter substrate-binding protein [Micromonospora maris]RUL94706.1 extracellular solute-binding protein [Verrucosispora sp. FIM060022]